MDPPQSASMYHTHAGSTVPQRGRVVTSHTLHMRMFLTVVLLSPGTWRSASELPVVLGQDVCIRDTAERRPLAGGFFLRMAGANRFACLARHFSNVSSSNNRGVQAFNVGVGQDRLVQRAGSPPILPCSY